MLLLLENSHYAATHRLDYTSRSYKGRPLWLKASAAACQESAASSDPGRALHSHSGDRGTPRLYFCYRRGVGPSFGAIFPPTGGKHT